MHGDTYIKLGLSWLGHEGEATEAQETNMDYVCNGECMPRRAAN